MLPLNPSKSGDLDLGVMTFHASRSCTERSIIVARHFFSFNFSSPSRISIAAQRLDRPLVQSPNIKQKKNYMQTCSKKLKKITHKFMDALCLFSPTKTNKKPEITINFKKIIGKFFGLTKIQVNFS